MTEKTDTRLEMFRQDLLQLELQLVADLARTDVLSRPALEGVLEAHSVRLALKQREHFHGERGERLEVPVKERARFAATCWGGRALGAFAGYGASNAVVSSVTTGALWWKSTEALTLAAVLAKSTGLAITLSMVGLVAAGVWIGGVGTHRLLHQAAARRVRKAVLADYRGRVLPGLLEWAAECCKEQPAAANGTWGNFDLSRS